MDSQNTCRSDLGRGAHKHISAFGNAAHPGEDLVGSGQGGPGRLDGIGERRHALQARARPLHAVPRSIHRLRIVVRRWRCGGCGVASWCSTCGSVMLQHSCCRRLCSTAMVCSTNG